MYTALLGYPLARGHATTHFLNGVPEVFDLLGNGRGNLLESQLVLFLGSSMLHLLLLVIAGYTATQLGGGRGIQLINKEHKLYLS